MGWNENKGLGANQQGIIEPIPAMQKKDRKGIGNKSATVSTNSKRIKITHDTVEETMSRRARKAKEAYEKSRDFAIRDVVYNDFEYLNM